MSDVAITVSVDDLTRCIEEQTYNAAETSPSADGSVGDNIQMISGDADKLLSGWLNDIWGNVALAASEYHSQSSVSSTALTMKLTMPGNFDTGLSSALKGAAEAYVRESVLSRWYEAVSPERAATHSVEASSAMSAIERLIHTRKRPVRR